MSTGGSVDVSGIQNYLGNQTVASLPDIDLKYYLSSDCSISNDDVLLGSNSSAIGSDNPSSSETSQLTIPNTTSAGVYYIVFSADANDEITESNENNNTACVQINIGGTEDITITNETVSPTVLSIGDNINVSANQNYSGNQTAANLPDIKMSYYLSTNCGISSDDILLGSSSSAIGSDNTSSLESSQFIIPNTIAGGSYYIIFSADSDDQINESDEDNNMVCKQIDIRIPSSIIDLKFEKQIKVYPNLTSDIVNLSYPEYIRIGKLVIYDITGRLWKEMDGKGVYQISFKDLSSGQYLLQAISHEDERAVFRIVKKQ